ncbi:DUF397 domain-containing protein [Actinomadura scrupuli]|uniref:DUF397 domain-containing protein n=1 Tax=Actinomadura scrupuli TaxID=559629 RepID=UPI003D979075
MTDFSRAVWRKSSHSSDDYGQCVELAAVAGVIGVRDSKQGDGGPVLEFSRVELSAFLHAVKGARRAW